MTQQEIQQIIKRVTQQVLGEEPGLDPLGQLYLVLCGEQGGFADAVQIDAHQVGGWTLGVQVAIKTAGGGICHDGLLIGWNFHELQRPERAKSSHLFGGSHVLICGFQTPT